MRIFVSYRRSDSKDVAARIADNFAQVREIDHVFLDVDSIAHGEDFPQRLDSEIRAADVCIAVIGPNWQGATLEDGKTRIWSERDFVRKEIATALGARKRVIPCLVDDAQMPGADELPDDIAALANKNAIGLRHTAFRSDFDTLCEAVLGRKRATGKSPAALILGTAWRGVAGLIVAAIIAIAVASLGMTSWGLPLETILGGRIQLILALLALLALCQIGTLRFIQQNA